MSNSVKNLFEKAMAFIKWVATRISKNKKWSAVFIVSILGLLVSILKLSPDNKQQLMKPIRICYVRAERLNEFKGVTIGGKKANIIENEIIKVAEKWTLPGSYIGFLILEVEKDIKLSITNLIVSYECQTHSLYRSTGFAPQNEILSIKNSDKTKGEWSRKSFSPDESMILFPFCITTEISVSGKITQDKIHELFNKSNHIIIYYHISKIKYKTNGSNKWQNIRVKQMESVNEIIID